MLTTIIHFIHHQLCAKPHQNMGLLLWNRRWKSIQMNVCFCLFHELFSTIESNTNERKRDCSFFLSTSSFSPEYILLCCIFGNIQSYTIIHSAFSSRAYNSNSDSTSGKESGEFVSKVNCMKFHTVAEHRVANYMTQSIREWLNRVLWNITFKEKKILNFFSVIISIVCNVVG